jgi:hypothetical protein
MSSDEVRNINCDFEGCLSRRRQHADLHMLTSQEAGATPPLSLLQCARSVGFHIIKHVAQLRVILQGLIHCCGTSGVGVGLRIYIGGGGV